MKGPVPQATSGYSAHWDVKTSDQAHALSHSVSPVATVPFPLLLLGVGVRQTGCRVGELV